MKFALKFDTLSVWLLTPLFSGRSRTNLELTDTELRVHLGWTFTGTIPRPSIVRAERRDGKVLSRGAHGWKGRWLVNAAGDDLVVLTLEPSVKARVVGVPVRLRELTLSVEDPDGFVAALS